MDRNKNINISKETFFLQEVLENLHKDIRENNPTNEIYKKYLTTFLSEKDKIMHKINNETYDEKDNDRECIKSIDNVIMSLQLILKDYNSKV